MIKFNKVIIIDWYDNIIKAFCKTNDDTYYCSLVAIDFITNEKIYICISIKYFLYNKRIVEIINSRNIKDNWESFYQILNKTLLENEYYLIKTKDLKSNLIEITKYKDNCTWSEEILFSDYPEVLDKSKNLDNWWSYW